MPEYCPEDLVRSVVASLAGKWQWQVATVDELVAGVCRSWSGADELTVKQIGYLAHGEYGRCLHAAALGKEGTASVGRSGKEASLEMKHRQERAYTEIGIYLFALACGRGYTADHAQEAVQTAVVKIHAKLDACRNPAAFLHWCWLQLRETLAPDADTDAIPLDGPAISADSGDQTDLIDPYAVDPEQRAICVSLWRQFLDRIAAMCTGEAKRAGNQIATVLLKFLGGMTDAEIAGELETSTPNVQVLRARGLERLRGDADILQISHALRESGCSYVAV